MNDVIKNAVQQIRDVNRCVGYVEGLQDGAKLAQKWHGANLVSALEVASEEYEEKHSAKEQGK